MEHSQARNRMSCKGGTFFFYFLVCFVCVWDCARLPFIAHGYGYVAALECSFSRGSVLSGPVQPTQQQQQNGRTFATGDTQWKLEVPALRYNVTFHRLRNAEFKTKTGEKKTPSFFKKEGELGVKQFFDQQNKRHVLNTPTKSSAGAGTCENDPGKICTTDDDCKAKAKKKGTCVNPYTKDNKCTTVYVYDKKTKTQKKKQCTSDDECNNKCKYGGKPCTEDKECRHDIQGKDIIHGTYFLIAFLCRPKYGRRKVSQGVSVADDRCQCRVCVSSVRLREVRPQGNTTEHVRQRRRRVRQPVGAHLPLLHGAVVRPIQERPG